jgi:cytochrome c-type biogenesis protein CcmH
MGFEAKLEDPAQEARAQAIFRQLRCMVCAGESIHDSNADLARDLRKLVRERVQAGETDEAVVAYIVSRYGDSILMKPPVKHSTYLLWFGPVTFVLLGILALVAVLRKENVEE